MAAYLAKLEIFLALIVHLLRHVVVNGFFFDWELRLTGADSDLEGRLEVRYGDQWGYVCADGFGKVEAGVVCNIIQNLNWSSQRLETGEVYRIPIANMDSARSPIILEGVRCKGFEDRIFECQNNGLFNASCPRSSVVGMKCVQPQEGLNSMPVTKTYVGVYFCFADIFRPKKLLLCDVESHWQTGATDRYLSGIWYSISNRYCSRQDPGVIQCNPQLECTSNDSVICIRDYSGYFIPSTAPGDTRPLRLAGGNTSQEGRLEVTIGGDVWGSVCSRFWGPGSASLVCRRLGFAGVEDYSTVEGNANASFPLLQYLSCNDEQETDWYDCLFRNTHPEAADCASHAYVKCSEFATEGTLRLTGTTNAVEGRLQIFHRGAWGGVRHRLYSSVPCIQLGYPGVNFSSASITFDFYPYVPVILDIISCNGSEVSVLNCEHQWYNDSYPDKYIGGVDVRCNRPDDWTPRLYNGTSVYEGRLELWEGSQWRRVCSSTIGVTEADVICKHLGHQSVEAFHTWPKFGNGISKVLVWSFSCGEEATSLKMCDFSYLTTRKLDCESVAIKCTKKNEDFKKQEEMDTKDGTNWIALLWVIVALLSLGLFLCSVLFLFISTRQSEQRNEPAEHIQDHRIRSSENRVPSPSSAL